MGYQFRTSYDIAGDPSRNQGIIMTVHHGGEEVGHLGMSRKGMARRERQGQVYRWPGIEIAPEHQGKGLALELTRRVSAMHPKATFEWHDFVSEGGLELAKKAQAENPGQHVVYGDDYDDSEEYKSRYNRT